MTKSRIVIFLALALAASENSIVWGAGVDDAEPSLRAASKGGMGESIAAVIGSDCCFENANACCSDLLCCDLVCFVDDFCCDFFWIQDCVDLAVILCGNLCDPGTGGGCPGTGDCCVEHPGTTGCDDAVCCEQICGQLPYCCSSGWDSDCADLAFLHCPSCTAPTCPQAGDCCAAHTGGGCERSGCCDTVCGIDPNCCSGDWNTGCALFALEVCGAICSCPSFADMNDDGDVDMADAAIWFRCFSGPQGGVNLSECACADYDGDGDIDLDDYPFFSAQLQGP